VLVELGGDPDARTIDGKRPIHWAAEEDRLDSIRALVACGASVNAIQMDELPPLNFAAEGGHYETVRVHTGATGELAHPAARKQTQANWSFGGSAG
jgi:ankyrin repeat protein